MKRLAQLLLVTIVVLAAVLLGNTLRRFPQPRAVASGAPPIDRVDAAVVAQHLAATVRFRTVSHQDPAQDDATQLEALALFLEKTYPKVNATMSSELVNGHGLLYRWQGTDAAAKPILLMAHQDVVPVEPGTEAQWTHPAFDGVIADGFVWGRGAIDDKGSLVCLFEALESLIDEGFAPARTIYFASGFDEEVGGNEGSKKIAELLASRGVKLAWVLDEGSAVAQGIIADVARPVGSIAISEKGYVSVELIAHTEGGHSSMPPAQTAIGVLSAAIEHLERDQMPVRLLPLWRQNFETLSPEMPFAKRLVMSNLWATEPLVLRSLAGLQAMNPIVRTTTAPTILEAGVKENVLPSTARGVVNFRLLPGDSVADVLAHVKRTVNDDRVTITKLERIVSEPAPLSSTDGPGYKVVERAIHTYFPDAVVVPGVVNGATDARHFGAIADDVYRWMPRLVLKEDLKRVHGTDERFGVQELGLAVRAYRQILRDGAGGK